MAFLLHRIPAHGTRRGFLRVLRRPALRGLRKLVPWLALLLVAACEPPADTVLLDRLSGIWETTEPRYAGCYFEIRNNQIVFHNGLLYSNKNTIMNITGVTDKGVGRYDIHYEDLDGAEYTLSLILYTSKKGDIIRFKNQYQIYWTRKPLSTL